MAIKLFTPALAFEADKPFAYGRAQNGAAGQFGGLGDWFSDLVAAPGNLIKTVVGGAVDVLDTATGAKANREAQLRAIELARAQSEAQTAQSQARSASFAAAAPWIGLGLAAVAIAVVLVKK